MGLTASLGAHALTIEPGESGSIEVTVRNSGPAAETIRLAVGGEARPFSYCVPDTATIEPGGEAVVRVGFRLPRTSVPAAGPLPFEVRVTGDSEPLARGVVEVAAFSVLSATLDPAEVTAKGASEHTVTVANRGNAPVKVTLEGSAADGLDVRIEPAEVVATADGSVSAKATVTPGGRRLTGEARAVPFRVVARPERGTAVEVGGRYVQQAAMATRKLVTSGVVAGAVVLALVLGLTVFSGGDDSPATDAAAGAAANEACPAEGHKDPRGISGLTPDDIPNLPNTFSFLFVNSDNCTPARFNPCEPVHYVHNSALAPPSGIADMREAFRRLSQATGIEFVEDGTTDETARTRSHYLPERYGQRWAPILVSWTRFPPSRSNDPAVQAVGRGLGHRVGNALVSGQLSLNVDAVTNRETNTPVAGGYGPPLGSGVGAVGPEGVTWGRIILHELAHVLGLGHTRDKGAIMYPESAEQTSRPADLREPDRQGLRYLGKEMGCLTTPPPA